MPSLFALGFIWGWSFLLIKVVLDGAPPGFIAWSRAGLGVLVLVLLLRRAGERALPPRHQWGHVMVLGVFSTALPFSLIAWGQQHITSALASVLNGATPLFAAAFAALILGERLRSPQLAGLALGLTGVAVIAGIGAGDVTASSLTGSLAVVGAATSYGLAFPYTRRFLAGLSAAQMATGPLLAACVVLTVPAAVQTASHGLQATPARVAALLLLGCVGTGFGLKLNADNLLNLGPTTASLVTYLVPVVGVTVGVAVLGEPFAPRQVAGAALIILSVALVQGRLLGASQPAPESSTPGAR